MSKFSLLVKSDKCCHTIGASCQHGCSKCPSNADIHSQFFPKQWLPRKTCSVDLSRKSFGGQLEPTVVRRVHKIACFGFFGVAGESSCQQPEIIKCYGEVRYSGRQGGARLVVTVFAPAEVSRFLNTYKVVGLQFRRGAFRVFECAQSLSRLFSI